MKVLVLNCGSSTLKFDLVEMDLAEGSGEHAAPRLAHGMVDRVGRDSAIEFSATSGEQYSRKADIHNHGEAVAEVFKWLAAGGAGTAAADLDSAVDAVGHRVVHGGDRFTAPTLINDDVMTALDGISELAPLHNPAALEGIRAAREALGISVPMVVVFDTAFHATLPNYARTYALPRELAERHHIRRYGFHGTAHEYMLRRYAAMTATPVSNATIITLQLGNGCSAAAIKNGRSVETSMGFTPLEGLVMGTRSGDLDPGIIGYLTEKEGVGAPEVERWLNQRSGLLGISGRSGDMRELLGAAAEDADAKLAVNVFCYRVRKYIGAYMAVLGGAQGVVFGGGIGEHAPSIRARICEDLEWCGLRLDPARNEANAGKEGRISADDSQVEAFVVAVDESLLIARYTAECVSLPAAGQDVILAN